MSEEEQEKLQEEENIKDIEDQIVEEIKQPRRSDMSDALVAWKPKTKLGIAVKEGRITSIKEIMNSGMKMMEPEIVDLLLPNMQTELLLIGQSKGKFGGGKRRVFKQTQKKTMEGNKPKFATYAVIGNEDGYVGIGYGKSKETVPAREKAIRNAKLNLIMIRRGNGSWQDSSTDPNTIPFAVEGKEGSVKIKLLPAPHGTGLKVEPECQKILKLAGIKDVWSKTEGHTKTKTNIIPACMKALRKLITTKIRNEDIERLGIIEGPAPKAAEASADGN